MFFANLILAASASSAIFAAPLVPRDDDSSSSLAYFTTLAAHSSSPIHNRTVNANGYSFWIGKETKSSCPVQNITDCPIGNVTVMEVNGTQGTCILDVEVPGGQAVYVAKNGSLAYTVPHTGSSIPAGGKASGFVLTEQRNTPYDAFTYAGVGKASSWLACPTGHDVWQIYVNLPSLTDKDVPSTEKDDCLSFDGLATNYISRDAAAWEYD